MIPNFDDFMFEDEYPLHNGLTSVFSFNNFTYNFLLFYFFLYFLNKRQIFIITF